MNKNGLFNKKSLDYIIAGLILVYLIVSVIVGIAAFRSMNPRYIVPNIYIPQRDAPDPTVQPYDAYQEEQTI